MSLYVIFQVALNVLFGVGLFIIWNRIKKPPQEDPRLSKGLQLLQSKISILEDLSDRTDRQVHQIIQILEQKSQQFQKKVEESNHQLQKINQSMHKSQELAKIFQDKIPHQEIIERQNTVKYIKAARMAHQGAKPEEIHLSLGVPLSEAEFISKVNKDQLMFDEEQLPEWARTSLSEMNSEPLSPSSQVVQQINMRNEQLIQNFKEKESTLKEIGDKFREACQDFDEQQIPASDPTPHFNTPQFVKNTLNSAEHLKNTISEQAKKVAQKAPQLSVAKILEASRQQRAGKKSSIVRNIGIEKAHFPDLSKDSHPSTDSSEEIES